MPGSDLLSRSRTLHYHRRDCISLLCSEWEQVVLQHCGRRAKRVITCACCKSSSSDFTAESNTPGLYGQASRFISTGRLHASPRFHFRPINVVVCNVPSVSLSSGRTHLGARFPLRCLQRLSVPRLAAGRCHRRDSP